MAAGDPVELTDAAKRAFSLQDYRPAPAMDGVQLIELKRFTDDGGTIYVHVMARANWPAVRPGDALVLANADYPDLQTLVQWRDFLEDARLYLHDELGRVVRWLEGR